MSYRTNRRTKNRFPLQHAMKEREIIKRYLALHKDYPIDAHEEKEIRLAKKLLRMAK
jgi:hypothetical protein